MYLEEITYYHNFYQAYYTPINYIFHNNYLTNIEKAIMLSELPAIFNKYQIPIKPNDLILFLNSSDAIATPYDIWCVLNSLNNIDKKAKRDALLTRDFFTFFQKYLIAIHLSV